MQQLLVKLDYPIYWHEHEQLWQLGSDEVKQNEHELASFMFDRLIHFWVGDFKVYLINCKFHWIAMFHQQSKPTLDLLFTKSWIVDIDYFNPQQAELVILVRIYNTSVRTRQPTRLLYY